MDKLEELKAIISKLPPRERFIIEGILDPAFQAASEGRIADVAERAKKVNDYLNAHQPQGEKVEYFADIESAIKDSLSFLETEYNNPEKNPERKINSKGMVKRAQKWGASYAKKCAATRSSEISSCQEPLSQDEKSKKQSCVGIRKLMFEAYDECQIENFQTFLQGLGIGGVAELVDFKNKYIANVMTQLVGGFSRKIVDGKQHVQEISCEHKASIVIGLPGAGKSTTIQKIKEKHQAFHIDADAIKEVVAKTFGVSINAPGMHQLSSYIRDQLVEEAKKEGVNLIIEKIGEKEASITKAGQTLKESGYSVDLSLVHITNSRSRSNNAERCNSAIKKAQEAIDKGVPINEIAPPRMVEDSSILKQGNGPLLTYLSLLSKRHEEGAVFDAQSKFFACDNEVTFLGAETAKPIALCGISDPDSVGCTADDKEKAEKGFLRLNATAQRVVAQKMLGALRKESAPPEQIQMLETFASASFTGSQGPQVQNISTSYESFISKCEALKESLASGVQLSDADMILLKTYAYLESSTHSILREIYNPEKASKQNDRRTLLESSTIEQSEIENIFEQIYESEPRKKAAAARVEQVSKQQAINREQARQAAADAASKGVGKGVNGPKGPNFE